MKKLTEGQKQKLFDVIRAVNTGEKSEIYIFDVYDNTLITVTMDNTKYQRYAWFQFVVEILALKVLRYNASEYENLIYPHILGNRHVIDYLYDKVNNKSN